MKRVIYLSTDPKSGKGGIASAVKNSMALVSARRPVGLIITHKPENGRFGNAIVFFIAVFRVLFSDRDAIYYLHAGPSGSLLRKLLLALWVRLLGRLVYTQYHSPKFRSYIKGRGFYYFCLLLLWKISCENIVLSTYWRKIFVKAYGSPCCILFNPIIRPPSHVVAKSLSRKHGELVEVFTVARLVPEKNVDEVLDLVFLFENSRLTIIGDGPYKSDLINRSRELGVSQRVSFLGWKSNEEVIDCLSGADVFILPSKYDSFGMVYLEALSLGVPILIPKIPAVKNVIKNLPGALLSVESIFSENFFIDKYLISEGVMDRYGEKSYIESFSEIML